MIEGSRQPSGLPGFDRSGLGRLGSLGRCQALAEGCWGEVPDRMNRGVFSVGSLGTDVLGVLGTDQSVTRCISIADASLSLSLSLLPGSSRRRG
jgi:hypothetical protein